MRAWAPPRQMWVMARASASAASAGLGMASSRRMRVTIAPTCALSARPLPDTAALTSLGVCSATGMPAAGGADHGDAAGLGGAHDGADVGAGEDPLDRDRVGPVLLDPGVDALLDGHQPLGHGERGRRTDDVDVDQPQRPADVALDDAHAHPGQPGVDAQHPHLLTPRTVDPSNVCSGER